ncbi:Uncharacterised protein [Chryseobacterium taklimakanense]|uniref:Type II toxin-antitoxin system RelE/ParE family toxin n=1 Tax=Chryseobacterium taklimakanense TaxID=536441 RepID=A0A239WCS1_9FLAO|nr:Uncharacterised protein [Chryseobacterium taklimakanense]
MEKEYEIIWTDLALEELAETFEYLEENLPKRKLTI